MKKAVIAVGGKQYLVQEGDIVEVEHITDDEKTLSFKPLLVLDGDKTDVGTPEVAKASVTAEIVDKTIKAPKVTAIRYKAKKRVKKVRGHRQLHTSIKINKIA